MTTFLGMGNGDTNKTIFEALTKSNNGANPYDLLNSGDPSDRVAGVKTIDDLTALVPFLHDYDPAVRGTAVKVLGRSSEFFGPICEALKDVSPYVRKQAIRVLEGSSYGGHIRPLLFDEDAGVRRKALQALVRDVDSYRDVCRMIHDPSPDVRMDVATYLIRYSRAYPLLEGMAADSESAVRFHVLIFFSHIPEYTRLFEKAVDDDSAKVRRLAVSVLAKYGYEKVLARKLEDSDRHVRFLAVQYLSGECEYYPNISRLLNDEYACVRREAIKVLADSEQYHSEIMALLTDDNEYVRCEVVRAVGQAYPAQIVSLLDDVASSVRVATIEALSDVDEYLYNISGKLQDSEWQVRVVAIRALQGRGEYFAFISTLTEDDHPYVRSLAQPNF